MRRAAFLFLAFVLAAGSSDASPFLFTLDPASPTVNGVTITPADILATPPPTTVVPGSALGLQTFFPLFYDHVNALSFGQDSISRNVYFSVDRLSQGLPGSAVETQFLLGDAAGSIFTSGLNGSNSLFATPSSLGLVPGFFGDDVASLALIQSGADRAYFSIDLFSTSNILNPGLSASILVSIGAGTFQVFATPADIGLNILDDIDGLVLLDRGRPGILDPGVDLALFSLSTFSNSVLPPNSFVSSADILFTDFQGSYSVFASAADLGLRPDDELNALATDIVPEPASLLLWIGLAAAGVGIVLSQRGLGVTRLRAEPARGRA